MDNVSTDYCQAARLSVRQAHQRGGRDVGFIVAHDLGEEIESQLRAGYLVESRAKNPARAASFCRVDEKEGEIGGLQQWIRTEKLDAVVGCGVDVSGLVARIDPAVTPRLAWASIDIRGSQSGYGCVPALHRELGRRAVELLIMRLQINLRGLPANPATTLLPVRWRERDD
jgi:DNA-binding LacI/PurR family transcriptional regulator